MLVVCGLFASLTCLLVAYSILRHLKNYRRPDLQRLIIRIMLMPAIYALSAWISFGNRIAGDLVDPIRDCYEAFVIWIFFQLMVQYLDGERALMMRLDDGRLPVPHTFPLSLFMKPVDFSLPRNFIALKRSILQFVLVKPILSFFIIILKAANVYEEGVISAKTGYIYISLLYNISICTSMYGLVLFYLATRYDLAGYKPMPKFLCIKAVIFFSFWQSFFISFLVKVGLIQDTEEASADRTSVLIQDVLICVEMMIAALAHMYAFSHREFAVLKGCRLPLFTACKDALGYQDLLLEMRHTLYGTDFTTHNDLFDAHQYGRLQLSPRREDLGNRFVGTRIPLSFDEAENDQETDRLYTEARNLHDGDYGYRVIDSKHVPENEFTPLQI